MLTAGRYLTMGATYSKLRDWDKAIQAYQRSLKVDPDLARAHLGIAHARLRQRQFDAAIDAALNAVELEHQLVNAHIVLAIALLRSQRVERAVDAAQIALRYHAGSERAHRVLSIAYEQLGRPDGARQHREQLTLLRQIKEGHQSEIDRVHSSIRQRMQQRLEKLQDIYRELNQAETMESDRPVTAHASRENETPLIIVSGLPRSGTSLMMQMLAAGGMVPMTDGERVADEDNPEGYMEWEAIKKVKSQPELMEQARGKVTKVISMLLPSLPTNYRYKVIFVLRPIEEVVASQRKMIERRGTKGAELDEEQLVTSLTRHREEILRLLPKLPMEVLYVRYHRILSEPEYVVERIVEFLGPENLPNRDDMAAAVRPDLYRNRDRENAPADPV